MKIALLMGSFNPIHKGHIALGRWIVDHNLAYQVWFVVSPANPFKAIDSLAPFEDRVAMAQLAVNSTVDSIIEPSYTEIPDYCAPMKVVDIENSLTRPSYTINTIQTLIGMYPDVQFSVLCGSDVADQLTQWHRYSELALLVDFIIYPRGESGVCSPAMAAAPCIDIDSTTIRDLISQLDHSLNHKLNSQLGSSSNCQNDNISHILQYIEPQVLNYIIAHNLYQTKND